MAVVEKLADDVFDLPANVLPVAIVGHTIATVGVNIEAQTIETIRVDIAAQTIDKIAIDIAAQTLSQLDVNIAASAVTVNVATAVGEHVDIDIAAQSLANVNVNIAAQAVTVNVKTPTGEHVDTDIVSSITLDINLTGSTITLPISVDGQTVELDVDISSQTLSTLNIDIVAQTLSDIDIDIVRQSEAVEDRKEFQEGVTDWVLSGKLSALGAGSNTYVVYFTVPSGYKYRLYNMVFSGTEKAEWWLYRSGTGIVAYFGYSGADDELMIPGDMGYVFPSGTYYIYVENRGAAPGDFIVHLRGWK